MVADRTVLYLETGLRNIGGRAAQHTVLNVLVPRHHSHLVWTLPNGGDPDSKPVAVETAESLPDETEGSWWISQEVERVALRTPRLRHARFLVQVPPVGEVAARLRVKAQSDDLPDDVEERVKDYTVWVSRS